MPSAAEIENDKALEEQYRRVLQTDFSKFIRQAWKVVNPDQPLVENHYIDAIAEHMTALRHGQFTRLIVNQPPRTAKSTFISILFPCWVWTTEPQTKFVFYTYSFDKLSVPQSVRRRRLLLSKWYQKFWGETFELSYDENMKWQFSNNHNGHMTVVTGATGTGGNFLIVDDPHSVEEAISDTEREAGVRKFREGLMTRLDNPESDKVCVVMQRLHDSDVSGSLLRDGNKWTHLCLMSKIEETADEVTIPFPMSGRKWKRKVGNLLDPTRLPDKILEDKKVELGTRAFEGQYQQRPAPPGGTIFQTRWWQWYKEAPQFEEVVISVDAAFKGKETSSDVAVHAWGMIGVQSYLIERDTRKMGFAATKAAIRAMASKHEASIVLIEDKANGPAIIEELQTEFFVIAIEPGMSDKVARAESCSPMVQAGTVFLPEFGRDGARIQALAAMFPNGDKDDIDALTQFLNWRRKRGASMKWFENLAKKAERGTELEEGSSTGERIEHPTPQDVQRVAMEQAGMKTVKPKITKQVKTEGLQKDAPTSCPECGGNLFISRAGRKCQKCDWKLPAPSREVNIG